MESKNISILGKNYSLAGTLITPDKFLTKLSAVIFYHGMISQSKPRYVKRAIKQCNNQLLIVESEFDDAVPKNITRGYYNTCPSKNKKLITIKGADHPLTNEKHNQEYTKLIVEWFKNTL